MSFTFDSLGNHVSTTLVAPHGIGDGVLRVADASNFSTPNRVTVYISPNGFSLAETIYFIVRIVGVSGNTLTLGPFLEGTSDTDVGVGARVEIRGTSGHYADLGNAINTLAASGTQGPQGASGTQGPQGATGSYVGGTPLLVANNLSDLPSAGIARCNLGLGSAATSASTAFESALVPTGVKTSAYTASVNDLVVINASSGSVTVTLPASPPNGSVVSVKMVAVSGSFVTTITRGGSTDVFNKVGGSTSLTLSLLNQGMSFQYSSLVGIWYVTSDDVPVTALDSRYSPLSGSSSITTVGTLTTGNGSSLSVISTGSSVSRTLSDRFNRVFDVRDYGAVLDGATDDTASVNAAVQAAYSIGGGTVYIPNTLNGCVLKRAVSGQQLGGIMMMPGVSLRGDDTLLTLADNCAFIYGYGTIGVTDTVTTGTSVGDTTLQVTNGTQFAVGATVLIRLGQAVYDSGEPEWWTYAVVTATASTSITIDRPLAYAMVVANTPSAQRSVWAVTTIENVSIGGFRLVNPMTGSANAESGVTLTYCRNVRVHDMASKDAGSGIVCGQYCDNLDMSNLRVWSAAQQNGEGSKGHGVYIAECRAVTIRNLSVEHFDNNVVNTESNCQAVRVIGCAVVNNSTTRNNSATPLFSANYKCQLTVEDLHVSGNGSVVDYEGGTYGGYTSTLSIPTSYWYTATPTQTSNLPIFGAGLRIGDAGYSEIRTHTKTFRLVPNMAGNVDLGLPQGVYRRVRAYMSTLTGVTNLFLTNNYHAYDLVTNGSIVAGTVWDGGTRGCMQFPGAGSINDTSVKTFYPYTSASLPAGAWGWLEIEYWVDPAAPLDPLGGFSHDETSISLFGTARDANIYRSAANTLTTDGSFVVGGTISGAGSGITGIAASQIGSLPSGMLKGSGGAIAGATAGTDYLAPSAIGTTVEAHSSVLDSVASATGTPSSTTYLRGDYSWSSVTASGANSLGTYVVQSATNAPANAFSLSTLSSGLLKVGSGGSLSTAVAGTDYQAAGNYVDLTSTQMIGGTKTFTGPSVTFNQAPTLSGGPGLWYTTGSTTSSPKTGGMAMGGGEAAQLSLPGMTAQGGPGLRSQFTSYWGIEYHGYAQGALGSITFVSGSSSDKAHSFYCGSTLGAWVDQSGDVAAIGTIATGASVTGSRPTTTTVGAQWFDTTLGIPIWWNGSVWKNASGSSV